MYFMPHVCIEAIFVLTLLSYASSVAGECQVSVDGVDVSTNQYPTQEYNLYRYEVLDESIPSDGLQLAFSCKIPEDKWVSERQRLRLSLDKSFVPPMTHDCFKEDGDWCTVNYNYTITATIKNRTSKVYREALTINLANQDICFLDIVLLQGEAPDADFNCTITSDHGSSWLTIEITEGYPRPDVVTVNCGVETLQTVINGYHVYRLGAEYNDQTCNITVMAQSYTKVRKTKSFQLNDPSSACITITTPESSTPEPTAVTGLPADPKQDLGVIVAVVAAVAVVAVVVICITVIVISRYGWKCQSLDSSNVESRSFDPAHSTAYGESRPSDMQPAPASGNGYQTPSGTPPPPSDNSLHTSDLPTGAAHSTVSPEINIEGESLAADGAQRCQNMIPPTDDEETLQSETLNEKPGQLNEDVQY